MDQRKHAVLYKVVTRLTVSAAVFFAGFSLPAAADWYAAVGYGWTELNQDVCDLTTPGCTEDSKDMGWKLAAGNQLNKHAAVELGYVDLGETRFNYLGAECKVDAKGFNAALVGTLPAAKAISFTGRVGLFRWDSDGSCVGAVDLATSSNGIDLTFGVGMRYDWGRIIKFRGEWERYEADNTEINLLTLGVMFMF